MRIELLFVGGGGGGVTAVCILPPFPLFTLCSTLTSIIVLYYLLQKFTKLVEAITTHELLILQTLGMLLCFHSNLYPPLPYVQWETKA